jgi:hypothetical protein
LRETAEGPIDDCSEIGIVLAIHRPVGIPHSDI